jgi:carbon-monoxide dehydrogenase small subunit
MSVDQKISFVLNGTPVSVSVPVDTDALRMIRDLLELTGTKYGCGEGECGACTILVDGVAVNACLMFAVDCHDREVVTIEGVREAEGLSALQRAFVEEGAVQCGFCTPGLVMQAMDLLRRHPGMSAEEIKRGIEGNLCRCTGYTKVVNAVARALHEATATRTEGA